MRDFTCCNLTLPTLHDLLQHYEDFHSGQASQSLRNQKPRQTAAQSDAKAARAAAATPNIQIQGGASQQPPQAIAPGSGYVTPQRSSTPVTPKKSQPSQQVATDFAPTQTLLSQDEDTLGDMEMDDDYGTLPVNLQQSQFPMQPQANMPQRTQFGQPASGRLPQLNMNALNLGNQLQQQHQGLRTSQPATPVSAGRNGTLYHQNPIVSSVNTPTLSTYSGTRPVQQQYYTPESSAPGTPGELDEEFIANVGNMQFTQNSNYGYPYSNGQDMLDYCIDEPAKRLFALNGGNVPGYNQPQQPASSSSATQLGDDQYNENSDIAKTIREEQKRAGVPDPSSDGVSKPFHCPVIGCEKAYKNHNGLKYHKTVSCNNSRLRATLLTRGSTGTTHKSSLQTRTVHFPLSILKRWIPIRVPLAWKSTSLTAAKIVANATKISMVSSTTFLTLQFATRKFANLNQWQAPPLPIRGMKEIRWSCNHPLCNLCLLICVLRGVGGVLHLGRRKGGIVMIPHYRTDYWH